MREILFRGWSEFLKEWEVGSLYIDLKRNDYYIMFGRLEMGEIPLNRIKVVPESVGQFTGLTDKNGVKIFEGDMVYFYLKKDIARVLYNATLTSFEFASLKKIHTSYHPTGSGDLEIIGNIHDKEKGKCLTVKM